MQGSRVAACGRETCWSCGKGTPFYNEMRGTSHPPEAMVGLSASPPQSPLVTRLSPPPWISRLIDLSPTTAASPATAAANPTAFRAPQLGHLVSYETWR
jgi:hypothetical protein